MATWFPLPAYSPEHLLPINSYTCSSVAVYQPRSVTLLFARSFCVLLLYYMRPLLLILCSFLALCFNLTKPNVTYASGPLSPPSWFPALPWSLFPAFFLWSTIHHAACLAAPLQIYTTNKLYNKSPFAWGLTSSPMFSELYSWVQSYYLKL